MSAHALYRLSGILLITGGLAAAIAHELHPAAPSDPAALMHYAHSSQPAHLLLFAGALLTIFGLPGHFLKQASSAGWFGLIAVAFLAAGILLADVLHCVLEFSVFPVLIETVPYTTIKIVETTYSETPLALLQRIGQILVFVGTPLTALASLRARARSWAALPLLFASLVQLSVLVPALSHRTGQRFPIVLYLALAALGIALFEKNQRSPGRLQTEGVRLDPRGEVPASKLSVERVRVH
jgi:hypothetical protein